MSAPDKGGPKVLPHNPDAERVLLGAIILDNTALESVEFIEPEHFFEKFNQTLFEKMRAAIRSGKKVAFDTIKTILGLPGNHQVCGIALDFYLHQITAGGCTPHNAVDYGREIRDLAVRRELIAMAETITKEAYTAPADASARSQIEDIEKYLYGLADRHVPNSGFIPFSETMALAVKMAGEAWRREGKLAGTATGFRNLDSKMGGLQRSDLIVVGGRPGMGKTALVTNIAYQVAKTWQGEPTPDGGIKTVRGGRVGFFSLEMSAEQLGTRIMSDQTGITSSNIRRGDFTEHEFNRMREFETEYASIPFHIDQTGGLGIAQLCSRARRLKRQRGLDLLVIDYIQLMAGDRGRKNDNRTQEVTAITAALKALAKELDIPIIAISQLSRSLESREDKRPQLSDLRESGSIEQDADVVIFVFRPAYYLELRQPKEGTEEFIKWQTELDQITNTAEIIIAKQRHGTTGPVTMQFNRETTKFSDLISDALPDGPNHGPGPAHQHDVPF